MSHANKDDSFASKKFDWQLWKKVSHYLFAYKKLLSILIVTMIVFAFVDAIVPLLSKYAIENFAEKRQFDGSLIFAGILILISFLRGFANWLMINTGGKINTSISYCIRRDCFNHIQKLSFSYFDKHSVGWLMSRLSSDTDRLTRTLAWGIVDLVWAPSMIFFMIIMMLITNIKLTIIVLTILPMLFIVTIYFQRIILRFFRKTRQINSEITASYNESITGAITTKTLLRESANLAEFSKLTYQFQGASIGAAKFSAIYLPIMTSIGIIGMALAFWQGGDAVIAGDISYGTLVAFIGFSIAFLQPVEDLARRFPEIQNAQAAAERILALLDTKPEIIDSDEVIEKYPSSDKLPKMKGDIEFKNVSFHYNKEEPILNEFNLKIQSGQTIALVGDTGSGKSTIANLLCRFYEPTKGEILIDNCEYRTLPLRWLHSQIGVVQQTPFLFNGTINENIRYGNLQATQNEIEYAAKQANAHHFIMDLKNSYDFQVGEGGGNLSTGQKQLLALARIIVAKPQLLVLDEATSSVDTKTEKLIQDAIDKVLHNKTSLIIAHRLSTIRSADRILLIRDGKIIEDGTHHELILKKNHYYKLYTSQFIAEKAHEILH